MGRSKLSKGGRQRVGSKKNRGSGDRRHRKRLAQGKRGEWERLPFTDLANSLIVLSDGERWSAMWRNNHHAVMVSQVATDWGLVTHLWVRRHDNKPTMPWKTMQRIKNELVGEDRCGVEVYPEQQRVVDSANMYHLWVMPVGWRPPFNLQHRDGVVPLDIRMAVVMGDEEWVADETPGGEFAFVKDGERVVFDAIEMADAMAAGEVPEDFHREVGRLWTSRRRT